MAENTHEPSNRLDQSVCCENNLASLVLRNVERFPNAIAIQYPVEYSDCAVTRYETLTYQELGERVAKFQAGFKAQRLQAGDRVVLLFPVSIDLYVLFIALVAAGLVVVFIDAGMRLGRILCSLKQAKAKAVFSVNRFLALRYFVPRMWFMKLYTVEKPSWRVRSVRELEVASTNCKPAITHRSPKDHALITFTSGSTGRPKAADRNHQLIAAQVRSLDGVFKLPEDASKVVMMSPFPVGALYGLCHGASMVIPAIDFSKPGAAKGSLITQQIQTLSSGYLISGPAFIHRICDYLEISEQVLDCVQRILIGGAPVSKKLLRRVVARFPKAHVEVIYGSTEAEPISYVAASDVLNSSVEGNFVGKPVSDVDLMIARLPKSLQPSGDNGEFTKVNTEAICAPLSEPGDVLVRGEHVLGSYLAAADNYHCKVEDEQGRLWHRMGDVACLHEDGTLELVGRYNNCVVHDGRPVYSLRVETPLAEIPGIFRAAYMGLKDASKKQIVPHLFVEPEQQVAASSLLPEIKQFFKSKELSLPVMYQMSAIPVDGRHNSKVDRSTLTKLFRKRRPPVGVFKQLIG